MLQFVASNPQLLKYFRFVLKNEMREMLRENEISRIVIGACIEVHKNLGPGLLETAYEKCLIYELKARGLSVETQTPLPIFYKDKCLDCNFRVDIWVEKKLIVELKAVEEIHPIHMAQIITYLKLTGNHLGLLVNFNVPLIKDGIKRVVRNI